MLSACKAAALLSLAALLAILAYQAAVLPGRVAQELQRRADAAQAAVDAARADLERTQVGVLERLASVERTVDRRLAGIERTADARLGSIQADVREQLAGAIARVDARLGEGVVEIGRLRGDLRPVLDHAASITAQVAAAAPLWLDCDHNADCAFNRWVGVARGVERMSLAVGKAAPSLTASTERFLFHFAGVTQDVHTFTAKFVAPRTFRQKLWDGIKTGSYVAGRVVFP